MPIQRPLLLALLMLLTSACAVVEVDETRDWNVSTFYSEAKAAMQDGDYDLAIKYYNGLEARFPFGRYATQSQLDIIYAYYRNGEPESALAAADRFIKLHPQNPYVDYAYYLKGLANYNRDQSFSARYLPTDLSQRDAGAALDSFNDFAELVRRFPASKYAKDARMRMHYLRDNLALYQIHVARYYMKRGAYLAAANRANKVVRNYQKTPAVKAALEIMIDAYTRLEMDELAADARRVLALNIENGKIKPQKEKKNEGLLDRFWKSIELDRDN